jgi:hypothetical protein
VQTSEEIHFARMADALSFIARYVDVVEEEGGNRDTGSEVIDIADRGPGESIRYTPSEGLS